MSDSNGIQNQGLYIPFSNQQKWGLTQNIDSPEKKEDLRGETENDEMTFLEVLE